MKPRPQVVVIAITAVVCSLALAAVSLSAIRSYPNLKGKTMTMVAYGGDVQQHLQQSYADPFSKLTGLKILQDSPTDYAKIKAQVDAHNVTWDVVSGEPFFVDSHCGTLFEPLHIDRSQIAPQYLTSKCTAPDEVYSFLLVYNKAKVGAHPPTSWADFFNTQKYPGKRAMWSYVLGNALEAALLGDGVPRAKLYPLDVPRALKKLSTIKSDLVFYDTLAQSQQQIQSGSVVMSIMINSRAEASAAAGAKIGGAWNTAILDWGSWAVPKGSKNLAAAQAFLDYVETPGPQAKVAELTSLAPAVRGAKPKLGAVAASWLPTSPAHAKVATLMSQRWWKLNFDKANTAFTNWMTG